MDLVNFPNSGPIWDYLDMTLGQAWVQINPTMGLNVVKLVVNISQMRPNFLFQHRLGITWELFPFPNLRYYFGK